jgi:hypothetical protein
VWLTKNVSEMQGNLGSYGVMVYRAPLGAFVANNYQILINTLPKFAQNNVDQFEVNSSRDCLLRYAGSMELLERKERGKLKNPLIWFSEGFRQLLALPVYLLNWFGLLNDRSVRKFTGNLVFKFLSGILSLLSGISALVTIIQGKEETISFLKRLFHSR